VAELIAEARDAVARESWAEAYQRLRALDPAGLSPRDLEGLADAAWWLCRMDESFAARQRAYAGYADAGDDPAAAMVAGRLCIDRFWRGEVAAGAGWLMRAQRHLRDRPECLQHGHLALCEAFVAHRRGELEAALPLTERAIAIGQRFGDRDLVAMGIHAQGAGAGGRRQGRRGHGAARRGDDLGGRRGAEPLLHRRDLLQRHGRLPRGR